MLKSISNEMARERRSREMKRGKVEKRNERQKGKIEIFLIAKNNLLVRRRS